MLEASPTFLAGRIGRDGRNAFIMGQRPQSVLGLFTGSMYTLVVGMIPLNNKLVRPCNMFRGFLDEDSWNSGHER